MFYCSDCANRYALPQPTVGHQSFGRCEACSKTSICFDVPSATMDEKESAGTSRVHGTTRVHGRLRNKKVYDDEYGVPRVLGTGQRVR